MIQSPLVIESWGPSIQHMSLLGDITNQTTTPRLGQVVGRTLSTANHAHLLLAHSYNQVRVSPSLAWCLSWESLGCLSTEMSEAVT
jgi:hypothetical protein